MFSVTSTQSMPILATYNPNGKIAITASAISEDLGNTFRTHIVEQKDPRFLYAIARAVTADIPNKNRDMFPLDEIKRAYTTFIGRNIFLDHNTTSVRNAVGKIIAAELREDEEGQTYVACLFKIDRELHPDIARKIENGIIDSVSMGANVFAAECCRCSNIAHRESEFCEHQKAPYMYPDYYSINHGVEFTELSLVSVPADPSAKMHKVFNMKNGMQKVAVGEADLNTVQKSGEQPNAQVQEASADEIPVQPQREDLPQPDTIKVEQPEPEVKGAVYQVDCSSNESADFIYNILYPYLNKGIDELIITGRGIKVFFDEQVKDPEAFIGEACSLFGLMMEKGIADQKAVASYDAFLKVQAKVTTEESSLLIGGEEYPLTIKYEDRKRGKGEEKAYLVTFIVNNVKDFLGKYDVDLFKKEAETAFDSIEHVLSSQVTSTPKDSKNDIAIKLALDVPLDSLNTDVFSSVIQNLTNLVTNAKDSKEKLKQEKEEAKTEKLAGVSAEASAAFLKAFADPRRTGLSLLSGLLKGREADTDSVVDILKKNKALLTQNGSARYENVLGAAYSSALRKAFNDGKVVDDSGNIDMSTVSSIFKEIGITDKQDLEAYINFMKPTLGKGDTAFHKFRRSLVKDTANYMSSLPGDLQKSTNETKVGEALKDVPNVTAPTDVKKGKGNPALHNLLNEEKPVVTEEKQPVKEEKPVEQTKPQAEPQVDEPVEQEKQEEPVVKEPETTTEPKEEAAVPEMTKEQKLSFWKEKASKYFKDNNWKPEAVESLYRKLVDMVTDDWAENYKVLSDYYENNYNTFTAEDTVAFEQFVKDYRGELAQGKKQYIETHKEDKTTQQDTKAPQEESQKTDTDNKEEAPKADTVDQKEEQSKEQSQDFTATLTQMENILSAMKAGGILDKDPKTVAKALVNTLKGLGADIQSSLEKAKESLQTKGMNNAIYDAAMTLAHTDQQSTDVLGAINDLFKDGKDVDLPQLANTLLSRLGVKLSNGFVVKNQDAEVKNAKEVLEYAAKNLDNVEDADKVGQAINLAIKKLDTMSTADEESQDTDAKGQESANDTKDDKEEQAAKQEAFEEAKETAETAKEKQQEKVDGLDGFDYQIWHVTVTKFNDATMDDIIHQLHSALASLTTEEVERVNKALKPFAENGPFFNANVKSGEAELGTKFTHHRLPDRYFTLNFKKLDKKKYTVEGQAFLDAQTSKDLALQEGESFKDVVMYGYNSAMDYYLNLLTELNKKKETQQEQEPKDESTKQEQQEQSAPVDEENK